MSIRCRKFTISGRVQGVFFRNSTRRKAIELDVTGYARNLDNGDVEVLACGTPGSVNSLEEWLWDGPSAARVSDVVSEDMDLDDVPDEFEVE